MTKYEQCPDCQAKIKTVPAGISKRTGKSYDEFQVCSNCEWKPPREQKFYPREKEGIKAEYVKEAQERKADQINEAQKRKEDSIAKFNAFNAAIELVKIPSWKGLTPEEKNEILSEVWELQDKIYQKHILGF
ncbi:MAG: hypothetical protein AABY22_05220 [Nanoarchaeota archaeon]